MTDQVNGNIFNNESQQGTAPETPTAAPEVSTVPEYLEGLVGDGKKYASVDNAMKSIPSAQDHIGRLEQENSDLRANLAQAEDLKSVVENNLNAPDSSVSAQAPVTPGANVDINTMIDDRMNARSAHDKASANIAVVDRAMKDKFGDKAQDVLASKASELGVAQQFLQDTAVQSPKAFLSLFGMSDQNNAAMAVTTTTSNISTEAMGNAHAPVNAGTEAYYDNMRRTNSSQYYSPRVQQQLNADMVKPGFRTNNQS